MSLNAFCDGACRVSNPGETSCAFVVFEGEKLIAWESRYLGPELHSNNHAEYQGLLSLLRWAAVNKIYNLNIYCDSQLVVNQVNDVWDVNSAELMPLWRIAYALKVRGRHTLTHIKGHAGNEGNELADWFCNKILDMEGK